MPAAPFPSDESERLADLRAYEVLDSGPETEFDDITRLATLILDAPIALISLVDSNRQWFKSCVGVDVNETSRDIAFCAYAILSDEPLVVEDATRDPRFADNPLVTGPPHVRFYAAAPLISPSGRRVGTLCVIDTRPRTITAEQVEALRGLARAAIGRLELRQKIDRLERATSERERAEKLLRDSASISRTRVRRASPGERRRIFWPVAAVVLIGILLTLVTARFAGQYADRSEQSRVLASSVQLQALVAQRIVLVAGFLVTLMLSLLVMVLASTRRKALDIAAGITEALAESELRLRSIVDHVADALVTFPADGTIESFNFAAERVFGYTPSEIIGKDITALLPAIATAPHAGETIRTNGVRKGGQSIAVELAVTDIEQTGGKMSVAIVRDVSERVAAERLVHDSEQRLKHIVDSAVDIIYRIDAKGRFTFVNATAEQILGYPLNEIVGRVYLDLIRPDYRDSALAFYMEQMREGIATTYFEFPVVTRDGREVWIGQNVQAIVAEGGVGGFHAVARDITIRHHAEEELRHQLSFNRAIMRSLGEGVCTTDSDGLITHMNPAAEAMLAVATEEMCGRECHAALGLRQSDGTIVAVAESPLATVLADGMNVTIDDHLITRRDGTTISASCTASPIMDGGEVIGSVIAFHDITERKRLENALASARDAAVASARLKSEFLANMSHEIRTPMNGIIGMVDILLDSELSADQRDVAMTARTSAESLLNIINDILDFSKIEAGKLTFDKHDFDLTTSVEAVVELLRTDAHKKGLEIASLVYSDVPRYLRGDSGRLRQVLMNLVGNAVKFTQEGEIVVRVKKMFANERRVVLRFAVTDTGVGIDVATRQRLFNAFTQADGSTTRRYGGTGLGLAISRQLVEMMSGTIGVDSEAGRGSTFWFTAEFDVQPQSAVRAMTETAGARASAPAETARRGRVLVAEDNAVNRRVALAQLAKLGYEADAVVNGLLAVKALEEFDYDIVLMDCQMPEMDGYEATRVIRSRENGRKRTRIVAMTAHAMDGDRERCLAVGMDDYVSKPIDVKDLGAALCRTGSEPAAGSAAHDTQSDHQSGALDMSRLAAIRSLVGGAALVDDVIELLLSDTPPRLTALRQSVERHDANGVASAAHAMRSGCAHVGADRMASLCQQLEILARGGSVETAEPMVAEIEREFTLVRNLLGRQRTNGAPPLSS